MNQYKKWLARSGLQILKHGNLIKKKKKNQKTKTKTKTKTKKKKKILFNDHKLYHYQDYRSSRK